MNWLFAWRYFKSKKSTASVNIIAWVGVASIIVGTAALIVVLSVFNGFEFLVKSMYSNYYSDMRIVATNGKTFTYNDSLQQFLVQQKNIKAVCKYVEDNALVINGDYQHIVVAKGVAENYTQVSGLSKALLNGQYNIGTEESPIAIIGEGVENALNISADKNLTPLTMYLPRSSASGNLQAMEADNLAADNINTAATFRIQSDFDTRYLITNIGFMQRMMQYDSNQVTGIEISLENPNEAEALAKKWQQQLGKNLKVQDRYAQNENLYNVMRNEKWFIYAVLVLVLIISAFTITESIIILIVEKKTDMQILGAIGATPQRMTRIFINTGLVIMGIGAGVGTILGLLICFLQKQFHLIPLQGRSFVIDYYPVKVLPLDVILTIATVCLISFIAAYIPALKLKKQQFDLRSY
jgi:lipoprotein-releasing system permease protein